MNDAFNEKRKENNKKLSDLLYEICAKYDLRMMQLIYILGNSGEDYFSEEPDKTIERIKNNGIFGM